MGFGHRVYRAEDPRAHLPRRKPDRVLATNVEFWSAVVLDRAGVPQDVLTALFACARSAVVGAHPRAAP